MSRPISELQNRLASTAKSAADNSSLVLDVGAQDYLGTLVSEAAEKLGTDAEANDIARAEESFRRLADETARLAMLRRQATSPGSGRETTRAPDSARPMRVTSAEFKVALKGLCPGFFPFC